MILYCAADLLWATKIKSTADALAIPCRPIRNLDMLTARLADTPPPGVKAVLIDLEARPAAMDIITHLRAPNAPTPHIPIVAFGPHVLTAEFQAARAAGVDTVMARGALHRTLPAVLQRLHVGQAVASSMDE